MIYINSVPQCAYSFIFKQFNRTKMKSVFVILAMLTIFHTGSTTIDPSAYKNKKFYLNSKQIIRKFGYPSESHTILTPDGYLLEMHRIPHGKSANMSSKSDKPPVFLFHGLLGSSENFFVRESEEDLPFLLSDLGFDVWLGNVRTNIYSKAHVTLHPDDYQFWNFSLHESAIYDAPSQIDFICNHTKRDKIIFIGFSMGTTIFLAMASTLPEYNKKIEAAFLMSTIAYVESIRSPTFRFLLGFSKTLKTLVDTMENGAVFPDSHALKMFGKLNCETTTLGKKSCRNFIFSLVGVNPRDFDLNLVPGVINHYSSGYSAKGIYHYAQLVKSGKFRQYDYGKKGNMIQYGSLTPPDYNLSLITIPIYMYEGTNDYLSDLKDANRLAKELKSLRIMRVVDHPRFTHMDFLVSFDAKKLVYDVLIGDLMSYLKENKIIN